MIQPPKWARAVLEKESKEAIRLFRDERLLEPLGTWKKTIEHYQAVFTQLFRIYRIDDPASLSAEELAQLFRSGFGEALRYMTGPPISEDDLEILADSTLAPGQVKKNPEEAARIVGIIAKAIDPTRFPWVAEKRRPRPEEKARAILASAALLTSQRISTDRRSAGKGSQEALVKKRLLKMNYKEIKPRKIRTLADAPAAGAFCGESLVGSRKADIAVRLFDGRLMPIECKVSNSYINSVKRLNNDAAVKAQIWHKEFGTQQVVPTAILSGVFKVLNLEQAQENGLTLFWAHRLDHMQTFIESTK